MFRHCKFLVLAALLAVVVLPTRAADAAPATTTVPVFVQRADKIVASLGLPDAAKAARVRDIIARQYHDLSVIHAERDARLEEAKTPGEIDKAAAIAAARSDAKAAQDKLHPQYLARLAAELTPAQVDQVKDGMTYGVLPLTFRVYQEMLPDLTAEQKAQLLAWLTEARELAMDASTSAEKHGWFGKYKGRINNYLSAAGIDMKKAEKDMTHRRKSPATK